MTIATLLSNSIILEGPSSFFHRPNKDDICWVEMENVVIGNQYILYKEIQNSITELFQDKLRNSPWMKGLAHSHA
jgi:hypothetical protein